VEKIEKLFNQLQHTWLCCVSCLYPSPYFLELNLCSFFDLERKLGLSHGFKWYKLVENWKKWWNLVKKGGDYCLLFLCPLSFQHYSN
jgi:hypothetical protein